MDASVSQIKLGGGVAVGGFLVAGGAAGVALIGTGSALLALPIVGIVAGAALIALGAYLYWQAGAVNPLPLSARPAQIISINEPEIEARPEKISSKAPGIAAVPIAAAALLSYAYLGWKETGLPGAGGSQALNPITVSELAKTLPAVDLVDLPWCWGSGSVNMPFLLPAPGEHAPLPKLETLLQRPLRLRSIRKMQTRKALPLFLPAPTQNSPKATEVALQMPLYRNNRKNLFFAASAFSQNFHAHSGLAYSTNVARSATPALINFEEPPCQITNSSACFGTSGGVARTILGANFLAPESKRSAFSIWTAAAAGAALAASAIAYLKSCANEIRNAGERLFRMKRPPSPPQDGKGSPPPPFAFGSGSGSFIASIGRNIDLDLPSLIPKQEIEPGLQAALEESLRSAGTWIPVDHFVQDARRNRLDPEPFLRYCERRGNLINVDQIDQTPFDEMRLTIDDEALRDQLLREDEEMEARAEEEDFQRRLDAVRNRDEEVHSGAGIGQRWDRWGSYFTRLNNFDDDAFRRQLREFDELEDQAGEEDLQRAKEAWRAEKRRVNRRVQTLVNQIQPRPGISARL